MKQTDETLLGQMQYSDAELLRYMELLELDKQSLNLLSSYKFIIEDNVDDIVKEFFYKQIHIDEIALLIGDTDTLKRLSHALRQYIIDLFSGQYDAGSVNSRLRIGVVHKRIGVEHELYLSAVTTLKKILRNILEDIIKKKADLTKVLNVLDKLFHFDTTLVFETYIDSLVEEVETEIYEEIIKQLK